MSKLLIVMTVIFIITVLSILVISLYQHEEAVKECGTIKNCELHKCLAQTYIIDSNHYTNNMNNYYICKIAEST